jgi:hypothetical protein
MNCPNCGADVMPGQLFCEECGLDLRTVNQPNASQPDVQQPDATAADVARPDFSANRTPCPDVCDGALVLKASGVTFDLPAGTTTLVGRMDPIDGIYPDIDLTPYDPGIVVSRRHALIHEQAGQWYIRDLNSTNYTVVNRHRVNPDQDYLIEDGDEIRFGRVIAVFKII